MGNQHWIKLGGVTLAAVFCLSGQVARPEKQQMAVTNAPKESVQEISTETAAAPAPEKKAEQLSAAKRAMLGTEVSSGKSAARRAMEAEGY